MPSENEDHARRTARLEPQGAIAPSFELDPPSADLRDLLSVLKRTRTSSDDLPGRAAAQLARIFPVGPSHAGVPAAAQSRLAISNLGQRQVDLYVMPTDQGGACYAIPGVAYVRTPGLIDDLIYWNLTFRRSPSGVVEVEIHGLVRDSVRSVVAVLEQSGAGTTEIGTAVSNNAFFGEIRSKEADPWSIRRLLVETADAQHVLEVVDADT